MPLKTEVKSPSSPPSTSAQSLSQPKRIMASLGTLEPFDINHPENWSTYYARFELFLLANDVQADRQKAIFLTLAGAPLYDLLSSLASPKKVSELEINEIKTFLSNHFSPRSSEIASFYKFHKRDQLPNESFSEYVAALRKLAVECNFGNALDRMLRDRLVCGLRDEALQRSLLAESDLQLQKVIDRASSAEASLRNVMVIRQPEQIQQINKHNQQQNNLHKHSKNQRKSSDTKPCNGCGGNHPRSQCVHRETICSACGIKGHLQRVCRSTKQNVATSESSKPFNKHQRKFNRSKSQSINHILGAESRKHSIVININGQPCRLEIDSGSDYTIVSSQTFSRLWPTEQPVLYECNLNLTDFQHNSVPVKGILDVDILYNNKCVKALPLIVVDGTQTNILGCNWFDSLGISIQGVHNVEVVNSINTVLAKFDHLFSKELGKFTGKPFSLRLKENFQPIRLPARRIPLALRGQVEIELNRLCSQGILEAVEYSDWATPIVPVPKSDGTIRICGDYKSTLNKALLPHNFQIPPINSLLSSIEGGKLFAKLDLAQAYQQLVVDQESALMQTIITHKGAFKVNRLQFGISSAPGIFQSFIETLLRNIPGVLPYFDDIVVMGKSETELAERLNKVLKRFDESGLRLKKDKCRFGEKTIDFLGFKIDSLGIRPSTEKIKSIQNAPSPKDKKQLQAFLGLLNFYHSFLPNKATLAEPLHRLLDKNCQWIWRKEHEIAFRNLKKIISSNSVLVHYDENLPLLLVCDASPYGIGAVLSHKLADGSERPIAFYSRTLSKTERNYSQIDREATAVVAGVKKFHDYLHGRKFTLVTDHRPLLGIFCTAKPTPSIVSTVMLRRCIFLNAYNFELIYREGKKMGNADCLSRLPDETEQHVETKEEVLMIDLASTEVVNAKDVTKQTAKDPLLAKVFSWALRGWPSFIRRDDQAYPYFLRRHEITSLKGCLLWGNRTIIPPPNRKAILHALHAGHPGIVKMKGLARSYVWWPNMDSQIESIVKNCTQCQETRHEKTQAPVHKWESTKTAWSRLHIDFAGPFQGKLFFLVVDSYSKWLEVHIVKSTSSQCAIKSLRSLFATHGLPDVIVSDNGTAFTSAEFQNFMENNLIRHVRCAPFHPSSNGQVERMVQTTKAFLKKMPANSNTELDLIRFVFNQHISPHAGTGRSPAELLFNRQLKSYFDKVHPHELSNNTENTPCKESFGEGDLVWIRNYASGPKWVPAHIQSQTGPLSYKVLLQDNRLVKRHVDQIRSRGSTVSGEIDFPSNINSSISESNEDVGVISEEEAEIDAQHMSASLTDLTSPPNTSPTTSSSSTQIPLKTHQPTSNVISPLDQPTPRRSQRQRKVPEFYSQSGR